MGLNILNWVYLSVFAAIYLHFVNGYVLSTSCDPYADDISTALQDAVKSHTIAYYSLVQPHAQRADWFGLINSVFPGVMDTWPTEEYYDLTSALQAAVPPLPAALASHQDSDSSDSDSDPEGPYWDPNVKELSTVFCNVEGECKQLDLRRKLMVYVFYLDTYELAKSFSAQKWDTIANAQQRELFADIDSGTRDVSQVTYNVLFSCDPRTFRKISGNNWWDRDTLQLYNITTADVICDSNTKTRLALRPEPFGFVVILCPAVLTQRDGEPKMWATLDGTELSNTRPSPEYDDDHNLTAAESLDLLGWDGMNIDQLRERVLSVYMGRLVLFLTGQKYCNQVYVQSPSNQRSFNQCKTLPLGAAIHNIDSLSIYSTGAMLYYNEVMYLDGRVDPIDFIWKSQRTRRWDTRGNLYEIKVPQICVSLPDEERPKCLNTVETYVKYLIDIGSLHPDDADWWAETHQFEPYYTYIGNDEEWIETGSWEWSVTEEDSEAEERRRRRRSADSMTRERFKA